MPITITCNTLEELKEFFNLDRKSSVKAAPFAVESIQPEQEEKKKRGRKPRAKSEEVDVISTRGRKPAKLEPVVASTRGRKPAAGANLKVKQASKRERGETLTARIQNAIQVFLDKKNSFTANDVYDQLVKKDPSINKQSVITSVLKQMNGTFKHVSVQERPGNGPRPVKLYNAA